MSNVNQWTESGLAALPVRDGFRQRGMEMNRLETFADAAFAFAVTLLVVGGGDGVPMNYDEMLMAMKAVPAFAASFANIMLFWYAHHVWSRRFGLEDLRSVFLTLLLIFVVLVYVYPLKAIYAGALDALSGGMLDSVFAIQSYDQLRILFAIFGIGYACLAGVIVLLNRYACACREQLMLSDIEVHDTRTDVRVWLINVAVGLASVILALILPDPLIGMAGMFYSVLGLLIPVYAIRRSKTRDLLTEF